ncbi:hypothetical protein BpHYR1_039002 [Brachionus plicatilis]|uniref:Uncharacterized protein n=1 Tax=Brachionus plicatilis TaxID=10195 RepID=A0A3M7SGE9_BRAPC|nr:hypothetical protein BpHYR1_039002 [Brachionus plicatilis]
MPKHSTDKANSIKNLGGLAKKKHIFAEVNHVNTPVTVSENNQSDFPFDQTFSTQPIQPSVDKHLPESSIDGDAISLSRWVPKENEQDEDIIFYEGGEEEREYKKLVNNVTIRNMLQIRYESFSETSSWINICRRWTRYDQMQLYFFMCH